jgi:hypothetical protein
MHLAPDWDDGAPEVYSERFLQARLAEFWRRLPPALNAGYIPTVAEERYEQFCTEFLVTLPAAFAIEPSKQWDERLQRFAMISAVCCFMEPTKSEVIPRTSKSCSHR